MSGRVLGSSAGLIDGGPGILFEVAPGLPAFVIRHQGRVHAYLNRCPHQGTPLDWEPGEFYDGDGELLTCASHGAQFEPHTGRCVGGPCRGAALQRVPVEERAGELLLAWPPGAQP